MMSDGLVTLGDFEAARTFSVADFSKPCRNGISCPDCGVELFDSCPAMTLTSNPPKKNIHCEACDYRGYRTA